VSLSEKPVFTPLSAGPYGLTARSKDSCTSAEPLDEGIDHQRTGGTREAVNSFIQRLSCEYKIGDHSLPGSPGLQGHAGERKGMGQ
jgi:hypothetical protein